MSNASLSNCTSCAWRNECGGLDGQQELFGCFHLCQDDDHCADYDWTCPCKPRHFVQRMLEVGGLNSQPMKPVRGFSATDLRPYVPMIRNASARTRPLNIPVAAVSTFDLLRGRSGLSYGPKARTAENLRTAFGVARDTRIILVSVATDDDLERYWAYRRSRRIPDALRALGVTAMTVPNYSFFTDAPRTHTVWNRRRMQLVAEELSEAGIAVVPHLNALTAGDWDYWAAYLRSQPTMTMVSKEFQTGLRDPALAMNAIYALERLQQRIGRALHPIIIGGARFANRFASRFSQLTIVDSMPFLKAVKRRQFFIRDRPRWRRHRASAIDALLEHNVDNYSKYVEGVIARSRQLDLRMAHDAVM